MLQAPDSYPIDRPPLQSTIALSYTLTPGRATGNFLAEIANRRIVGSRFKSGMVCVPAEDFCPSTGEADPELVEAPDTGTLTGFTQTAAVVIASIRIDGASFDFVHRMVDASPGAPLDALKIGARVRAVWAQVPAKSVMDIAGFQLAPDAPMGAIVPLHDPAEPVMMQPYDMALHYNHAFGPFYSRMFDEIGTQRHIMGVRSSSGEGVLIPPRALDDISHTRTGTWAALPDTGTVSAMSVIHLEFKGQKEKPPYIYAEIQLDGAVTRLIHSIKGIDMSRAAELVKPGTRVRAVWSEARTGSLSDISHFEPIDQA